MTNGQSLNSKKILIVEDDLALAQLYSEKLSLEGFTVTIAKDGAEGLTTAKAFHPDLILLDLALPKMDGMGVLRELRNDDWGKNVPIVILTNLDPNDTIMQGIIQDQPAYYLIKANINPDDVLMRIRELLYPNP